MPSLLFLLISILVVHNSFGHESCIAGNGAESKILFKKATQLFYEAREMLAGSDDTSCYSVKPRDCQEILNLGYSKSGVYTIWVKSKPSGEKRLKVYCDMETNGGGWTVIQRRGNYSTPNDYFYRGWYTYKEGFGNLKEEFWLGNDNIHYLSTQKNYSVRFDLRAASGAEAYAEFSQFNISDESRNYTLFLKGYNGNAGDPMIFNKFDQFSTKDRNNLFHKQNKYCSDECIGGWWYHGCCDANINGLRGSGENEALARWATFDKSNQKKSLEHIEMKIRPLSSQ